MADPLTSSERIRERMGFGVSPLAAPETRRAYAAAGLSPLGTQDRERLAAGAGISPMAGQTEREAWKMAEYMSGRREQAPVEYGGIGDRPTGSSRRAIRMQDEWDKKRAAQLKEMEMLQQMEAQSKQMESTDLDLRIKDRTLRLGLEEDIFNKSQQERVLSEQEQAFKYINAVRGQPNAYEAAAEAIAGLPFAAASEPVQKALWALGQARQVENTAQIVKEQRTEQRRLMDMESDARQSGATQKEIESTRRIDPDGNVYIDEEALRTVRDNAKLREKQEGAREPARTRVETLRSEIVGLEAKIETFEEEDEGNEKILELRGLLAEKRAQLKDEQGGAEEPEEKPKSDLPNNGEVRNGFRYTGPSNDKKAASNPDNWVRE